MNKSKDLVKVCYYARVSTNSEDQRESFENQKEYFERELSKENGFDLVGGYADRGLTATSFNNRTQFVKMLADAGLKEVLIEGSLQSVENKYRKYTYVPSGEKPKFKYIYVKNSSRFARNIEVIGILRDLRRVGVFVYFLDINKSNEDPSDEMMLNFIFSMDEKESLDKREKVKFGAVESAKRGRIRIGRELFGYTYNKEENTLREIKEESEIIKLIFDLRLQGKGSRQISKYLKENNILTRAGNEWRHNTITRTLQNPIYTGRVVRNKWDCQTIGGQSRRLKNREEWIVQETNRIDRIISDQDFDRVQELIKASTGSGNKKGTYLGRTEFATKIKCSKCGSNYVRNVGYYGENKEKKRIFYNCARKKVDGVKACNSRNIQLNEIEEMIKSYCNDGVYKRMVKEDFKDILNKLESNIKYKTLKLKENNISKEITDKKEQIEKEKNKLQKLIDNWLELTDNDNVTISLLKSKREEIKANIKKLELQIEKLESGLLIKDEIIDYKSSIEKKIKNIKEVIDREVYIREYLYNIVVEEDRLRFIHNHNNTVNLLKNNLGIN